MIRKIFALNVFLSLLLVFPAVLSGQRIGVVEKNIFHSLFVNHSEDAPRSYKLSIRELFEKKNEAWTPLDNSQDEQSKKPYKTKVNYVLGDSNNTIIVSGIRNKKSTNSWLASELFTVQKPKNIKLKPLPKTILQGFEHNDILASRIIANKSVLRKNISVFRTEYLTDTLKNKLYEILVAKYESCYFKNDTTYFMAIKKSDIHNQVKLITDSIKLGQVDIVSGNNCFAEPGRSYGGGILHYIIYPNQEIKLLVTNTELLDVADYDKDGKYEYIFFKSWFNNYGYIMYYNNFQDKAVNDWSYH